MNDIFRNPAFKQDFAFIKQLEEKNKAFQDKIWEKYVRSSNKNEENVREVNHRFESHPSGFSSESEKSIHIVQEEWYKNAAFNLSNSSLELKSTKEKSRSTSASKIVLSDAERKKLRQRLTKHVQEGTMDKFEIRNMGDHASKDSKMKTMEKEDVEVEEPEEVYLDRWEKSESTSNTVSEESVKKENEEPMRKHPTIAESKMSEEIERLKAQLKIREKTANKSKTRTISRKVKSHGSRERRTSIKEVNAVEEMRKSKYYIEKCIGVIKELSVAMNNGIEPPDGSDDYARRQVRTKEFTSRFSRIYLYPLLTQISRLNASEKATTVFSRFTSVYQLTYQALQACINHFPNTVGTASYQKLKDCLNCVIDICDKSENVFRNEVNYDNEDYVFILRSHCLDLSHKIDDNFLAISTGSLLYSKSTKSTLVPAQHNDRNACRNSENNRKNLQQRLSMYSSTLAQKRNKQWRKMLAAYEEKKPKVKSRYKTATFKHRPPVEKTSARVEIDPRQHRLDDERSLVLLRNTPVVTPINEDNIKTMIQYENERGGESDTEDLLGDDDEKREHHGTSRFVEQNSQDIRERNQQQDDILTKLLQLVNNSNEKQAGDMDANLTNTIMVLQKCLSLKNHNTETAKKVDPEQNQQLTVHSNIMEVGSEDSERKTKKEPKITVTGTKNAQLICINDENSIMSVKSEHKPASQRSSPVSPKKTEKTTEIQPCKSQLAEEVPKVNRSKSSIRINRVKKPRNILQLLPKDYAINIIQYKLMFYKHHKGNYMYKKTPTTQPWELMDKISEDLLDYALLGISREIEINELLENLYNAEFQY